MQIVHLNEMWFRCLGFAPEAKVWEVRFTKTGEFQEVKRAFELTGHTSGVYDVAFDVNSSHMATVSKDGTWKLFNTKGMPIQILFKGFLLSA